MNELTEVMERLRALADRAYREYESSEEGDRDDYIHFFDDWRALSVAADFLAEHSPDSETPIDEDWLRSVGFDMQNNHKYQELKSGRILVTDFNGDCHDSKVELQLSNDGNEEWVTDLYSYGESGELDNSMGLPESWCRTRGDVIRLASALGAELKETP